MPFVADKTEESVGGFVPDSGGSFVPDAAPTGQFVPDHTNPTDYLSAITQETSRTGRLPSRDVLAKLPLIDRFKLMGSAYWNSAGNAGANLYEQQTAPQIHLPSAPDLSGIDIPGSPGLSIIAAAYNAIAKPGIEGLSSPVGLGTLPLAAIGRVVPAAKAAATAIGAGFTGLMANDTLEQIGNAKQVLADPNATTQQKQEAVLAPIGTAAMTGLGALGVVHEVSPILADRIKLKTPEQKSKAIHEEIKSTDNKAIANALTDAADAIDRDIAAAKLLEDQQKSVAKAQSDQQRAIEQQQKALADQQKQAVDAAKQAQEVPKSTQILQESQTPPPLANIATEIGTQTSPYAVQEKLNALTAVPDPALDQIPGPSQLPAVELSPEALAGRQRASSMRRGRDAGPVLDEIAEPAAPKLEQLSEAKAAFERRKAIFDAQKRAEKEASAAQKVLEEEAADEAKWMAEQEALSIGAKKVKEGTQAPVEFVGIQEGLPAFEGRPAMPSNELFNLTEAIPGHPVGSTLTRQTLEGYGYEVPKTSEPVNIGKRDESVSSGTGVPTDFEKKMIEEWKTNIAKEASAQPSITGPDNRYNLIKGLSESKLVSLSKQLGVDPKGMSGERLRSRVASNAREADIIDAIANPVAEVAPKRGKIKGSAADKWAQAKIEQSRGQVNAGIDPELMAAHVIKLSGQLESGAIKFGEWSKRMVDELGEQIRPLLSRIWEEAHTKAGKAGELPPEPRIISGAEENRAQSEAATGHEYLKDTNKAQEESGQRYVDYVKKTQDWEGAIDAIERIPHIADRSVAVSQLLAEANRTLNTPDTLPEFDRLINRLAPQVMGEKTELGQGLQSQQVVNRIIEPLRPYLGWRRMIQTRLSELANKFTPDAAEQINKGMKEAGNEAAKKLTEKTPSENPEINKAIDRVRRTGVDAEKIFTDLPENQEARKKEIFDRINSDRAVETLSPESKKKLADAMEQAWNDLRNKIFRREFDKVIKLPNIGKEQREVLEKSLPKIVERANLGLMDSEAFLNAIGDRYGIEGIDGPTGKKLRDLGQKAARAPEGIERNEIYQQIMDTIMQARGVNAGDFLKDYWYRNVMSAPRTAVEIGAGGIVQGMARTFTTAVDTAVALKRPDIAFRMIGMFLKDAATGARLGYDLVKTGDRAILPRYKEQFLSKMDRLEQGKSPGGEIESLYRRSGPLAKVALSPFELTGRILTGLDYIGGQGVRSQQMLYSSLVGGARTRASFEAVMRRFNANEVKSAEQQARTEIGPEARPAQVIARSREILNEGISKEIQAFGNNMTEVTALNAPPVGLGGEIYKAASQIPMVVRAPSGLGFVKAMINLIQESSNWAPITGQINVARALWRNPSKNNPFRWLALDKLPPERARQLVVAQGTGLALMLAAANKFLSDQPEDKEGRPRNMDISGGWGGLTPTQKSALMSAGEKPFAIKVGGRWIDYKLTPFVASLATIGHWRDQQRFKSAKWNDETLTNKVGNAWLSGLGAVRDLSVSSQFSSLAGHMLASDSREMDTKGFVRTLTDTVGNAAMGLIPMSSLLRELDQMDDKQRYRPGKKNPGIDLWLTQIPFVRRTVGDGPLLDFLGRPVNVEVNPFNRHIGPAPSNDPVTSALSDKVSMGMKLPTLADNTSITEVKNGKLEKRPMTDEESYNYQKAVRQGFARQITNDLPVFIKATPEQAAMYAQEVFTSAERYARDRLNTGAKFDGTIPVNPKLSSALSPDYQRVKEMDASDSSQSAVDRSNIRVKYDEMMALPPAQRLSAIRDVAVNNPELARKFLRHIVSPATERNALEKATGALDASTRAEFFTQELSKRATSEEKQAYIAQQLKAGLITKEVLRQMAVQGKRN